MRPIRHDCLRPKPARRMTFGIELGKRRKPPASPAITIRVIKPRQMNSRRGHIRSTQLEIIEVVIESRRPTPHIAIPKILRDSVNAEQLHIPRSKRVQISLKPHVVEN